MRRILAAVLGLFLISWISAAGAVEPNEMLADPTLEARARALSAELRCVVCQNQSIDDSNAPLAKDLRLLVRERLVAGDGDREVIEHIVARYGEYVLLRPTWGGHTALLWLTPAVVLLLAGLAIFRRMRSSGQQPPAASAALTPEEQERLKRLLDPPPR